MMTRILVPRRVLLSLSVVAKVGFESSRVSVPSPVVLSRCPESVVDDDDSSIIGSSMIPPVWVLGGCGCGCSQL